MWRLLIPILGSIFFTHSVYADPLCSTVTLTGKLDPGLDDVEKTLLCGEPGTAWATIPYSQVKYNLTNFLQKRGYLHPQFQWDGSGPIRVDVGERSYVTRVVIDEDDAGVPVFRMRQIIGQPLSPSGLNSIEKWVSEHLQTRGYACPKVTTRADPDTGEVHLQIKSGPLQAFANVTEEAIPGVESKILRRYDPFEIGGRYDEHLLKIASNRVTSAGLVETSHFRVECRPDGAHVFQNVISGPPRLLVAGVGINTEGVLLGKLAWKNTRLGRHGSLLDFSISGSARLQTLQGTANWYFLPYVSRFFLSPKVQLNHYNEQPFEVVLTVAQAGASTTFDRGDIGLSGFLGPSFNFYRTLRGVGAPEAQFLFLENRIALKSHDYEFYTADPRAGYVLTWMSDMSTRGIYSSVSAQRMSLQGEFLWSVKQFEPPLWIVGIRGGIITIATGEHAGPGTGLPAPFLQYLGGSANLRGFGRQELPASPDGGGLTSGFLGLELRLSHVLPAGFDPFLLMDMGAIGRTPFSFDAPFYWSPGIGIRWASPVGPFRTTLAHGFSNGKPEHLQFYFSLGEEF